MRVFVCEKPKVAKAIAKAIGGFTLSPSRMYLTNKKDTILTWAFGHLIGETYPTENDLAKLPMIPNQDEWVLKVSSQEGRQEQFDEIKKLLNDPENKIIVNACDAAREGELIFRLIYEKAESTKPIKRMWISSMSDSGLKKAYENLEDGAKYEGLSRSARCRSQSDWLIGINGTIAATAVMARQENIPQVTAVGRVKSPVLTMLVHKQREIDNFVPLNYWLIDAEFKVGQEAFVGGWIDYEEYKKRKEGKNNKEESADEPEENLDQDDTEEEESSKAGNINQISSKEKADQILSDCKIGDKIKDVSNVIEEKSEKTEKAPHLYNITDLQFDAEKKFRFSTKKTLELTQELYEKYTAVTYPRTDSCHLPEDYIPEVSKILDNIQSNSSDEASKLMIDDIKKRVRDVGKHVFDSSKVTDHFAIIPTGEKLDDTASTDAKKVYSLILDRFKEAFLEPMQFSEVERISFIDKHAFRSVGRTINNKGWRDFREKVDELRGSDKKIGNSAKKNVVLPLFKEFSDIKPVSLSSKGKKTSPPKPYTQGKLAKVMENISRIFEGEQKEALKNCGIGTSATRAEIIHDLLSTESNSGQPKKAMIEEVGNKKFLKPTEYGFKVVEFLEKHQIEALTSVGFTANWEIDLAKIRENPEKSVDFMQSTHKVVTNFVQKLQQAHKDMPILTLKNCDCPECGSTLNVEPKYVVCSNLSCNFKILRIVAHLPITDENMEVLIKEGETPVLSGFIKKGDPKNGTKDKVFMSALKRIKNDDGSYSIQFYTPTQDYHLDCPLCNSKMLMSINGVSCVDKSCNFTVWRTVLQRRLSDQEIEGLIKNGETEALQNFKSQKSKEPFAAKLVIDKESKKVGLSFENVERQVEIKETNIKCTLKENCKGKLTFSSRKYSCNTCGNWISSKPKIAVSEFNKSQMTKLLKGEIITVPIFVENPENPENKVKKMAEFFLNKNTRRLNHKVIEAEK